MNVFRGSALRLREGTGPDEPIFFQSELDIELIADDNFLVIDATPGSFGGPQLVNLGTGNPIVYDDIEVVEVVYASGPPAIYLSFFEDRQPEFENLVRLTGPAVPVPAPGTNVEQFLLANGVVDVIELSEDVRRPGFREGDRIDLVDIEDIAFVTSGGLNDAQARTVAYLYEAGLDRDGAIDEGGLNFWIDQREAGLTEKQLATAFLESREFEEAFGDPLDESDPRFLDDTAFVTALYENVLDRAADQGGLAFWLGILDRPSVDRADLLLAFAESGENVAGSPGVAELDETAPGVWEFA